MLTKPQPPRIPLPKGWQGCVKSAVLHAIALAHDAIVYVRAQVAPRRWPHCGPYERMAILGLRAARGWSLKQTADTFLVTQATIASWVKRINDQGAKALLQLREPVNRFPDFVRYIVQRLKTLNPSMSKVKIAETLCRAGLHPGVTTVGRILKEEPQSDPGNATTCTRVVTAKYPNHVWHVDLTAVPTSVGFWAPWLPFALPQCWPFFWWVAAVIDHHSRCVMGIETFRSNPTTVSISRFLECAIHTASATPKYIICDKGQQFWCSAFKDWCDRQGITPCFGAVGQHGSIALIERYILSLKNECTHNLEAPAL